ncbi:hypothetical protein [uncultured Serinicoccus sp.]|uniref:hypothetical protein n=1 Tax=uncultured Serinicoccus sp. TaxID=735514 RepID=UPI00260A7D56|nr:hypothetical protein [uncultured Serinicoccus sp.]
MDMDPAPAPDPDTAAPAAVRRYAVRFDSDVLAAPGVGSGLGAWLLLALVADQAEPADRALLEDQLGLPAGEARAALADLLADPHPAVSAAVARWADAAALTADFGGWAVPGAVEDGPLPDQAGADRWTAERTGGLIETFPLEITELTRLVLASALATRISWRTPLVELDDGGLGTDAATARHLVLETVAAGPVGVVAPTTASGLTVVSVVADPAVPREQVIAAAHEVAAALASTRLPDAVAVLEDGHAWTVSEHREVRAAFQDVVEEWSGWVPSWRLTSEHDLADAPGFATALASLARYVRPEERPAETEARQAAVAAYSATGFEAAAVTGMGIRATGLAHEQEVLVRRIHLRLDRPHAVVAVALDTGRGGAAWHGIPVFTAWVDPTTG